LLECFPLHSAKVIDISLVNILAPEHSVHVTFKNFPTHASPYQTGLIHRHSSWYEVQDGTISYSVPMEIITSVSNYYSNLFF